MSATPDSTLANPEQRIADLERQLAERVAELAERTAERDEAQQRETATAEVLGVINSSPGDLAPVFDAMLERAMRLCDAAYGNLHTFDGERFHPMAMRGEPRFVEWWRQAGPFQPAEGSSGPLARILRQRERLVCYVDAMQEETYHQVPGFRELVNIGGIRSLVCVALTKEGALFGTIGVYRREVRPFSDKQIALLQNFAAQAVIAMENARLITETREALEQQTATAEVLGVINASPGDLAPVFDAMLERATALCGAAFGTLATYDGERFAPAAAYGVPPAFAALRAERGAFAPPPGSSLDRVAIGESLVHITDVMTDPGQAATPLVKLGGCRSLLCVALRKDGTLIGAITAYRQEVRPFSDKQISLLQNFAAQAVIAIENARLITETREALEQQTATAEVLQVINSSPGDLGPVFDAILEKAHALCGAEVGTLAAYDGEHFHALATFGYPEQFAEFVRRPFRPNVSMQRLIEGERVLHFPDQRTLESEPPDAETTRAFLDLTDLRTTLFVALRKDTSLLGYISAHRHGVLPFSEKQIALLQNFAAQAVIAMENARLLTETREALEQQTATAEVLQVINSSPGTLGPVFDAILAKALLVCAAEFGTFYTFDGEEFHSVANRGAPTELEGTLRGHFVRLIDGETIVHIPDLTDTDMYRNGSSRAVTLADIGGARTTVWLAVRTEQELLGVLVIYRQEVRPFSDKEIALLKNFAAQAVIAMENARLLGELHQRTDQVAELNRGLEARVAEQVDELGRVGRLKRFLAPQLAELIVSQGDEKILESHRREIVVVFCDLRGYTAFTETAEPEEVLDFLREYHGALGPLVSQFEGTLDQFSGDGIMVFFNDPVPCPDPAERAVKMAMAMREAASNLIAAWRRLGRDLGFGAGIAQGYATLGQIGFSERSGYTAIGTVCNVAARLCAEAKDGQILISQRVAVRLGDNIAVEDIGSLALKGLMQPVAAFNVPLAAGQPALRVIEGGPQSG